MSLIQRMERAQQAKASEAAAVEAAAAVGDGRAPVIEAPRTSGAAASATASAVAPPAPAAASPAASLVPVGPATPSGLRPAPPPAREDMIREVRLRLQGEVVNAFHGLVDAKEEDVHRAIEALVDRVIAQGGFAVTRNERAVLVESMVHDVTGFGPLEPLLADPSVTEVMVNGSSHIYVERRGKIQRIDSVFLNDEHVLRVIDRIITPLGRRIDESSPRVDARLPDGSRVNAIIEPLSLVGPVITVGTPLSRIVAPVA